MMLIRKFLLYELVTVWHGTSVFIYVLPVGEFGSEREAEQEADRRDEYGESEDDQFVLSVKGMRRPSDACP